MDSTSDHLRRLAAEPDRRPEFWTVVVADRQTAGHGQHGRPWVSDVGGLYASVFLPPDVASPVFTLIAGLAALAACKTVSGAANLGLKWVNDLVWLPPEGAGGQKIGGLLAEVSNRRFAILGLGINVAPVALPEAGSLEQAAGRPVSRSELLCAFVAELRAGLERWREEGAEPVIARWKAASVTLGRQVQVDSGGRVLEGLAEDVDPEGRLVLRLADGRRETLASGTVRLADGSYA